MNISPDNIYGDCELKCMYSFNYPKSSCTATNNKYYIRLTYDTTSVPAVKFNNASFNVSEILLVSPSVHKFNGTTVDAELIIVHTPIAGGYEFCVCVPIVERGGTTKGSTIIETIVSTVANQAPSTGETAVVPLDEFTLNSIVPMSPFYSYSVDDKEEFIVYGEKDAINISQKSLKTLQSIITAAPDKSLPLNADIFATVRNGKPLPLFINKDGPKSGEIGDGEIYIDCRPTGNSEETTNITKTRPNIYTNVKAQSLINNPIVIFILSSLFTLIILYACYFLITVFSSGKSVLSGLTKNKS